MDAWYLAVYRVVGIIGLPDDTDVELLPATVSSDARAFLTIEEDIYLEHLRRIAAFSATVTQLSGAVQLGTDLATRFASVLARTSIRADGLNFDKPLLVVSVSGTTETARLDRLKHCGDFSFGAEVFDRTAFAERAKQTLEAAAAGLSLALPGSASPDIKLLGEVAYLTEPDTGRILYSLALSIRASGTSGSSMTRNELNKAAAYAHSLRIRRGLETVTRLLSRSMQATDNLEAFLTAWAGLEVFVNKTFKETYETRIYSSLGGAAPLAAAPFIVRLREVMRDKYNIRDKFVVLASTLDEADADRDIELFKKLKSERDELHQMNMATHALPTEQTQSLLRKYLRLHLSSSL